MFQALREELATILDGIEIQSPHLFRFGDLPVTVQPGPVQPLAAFPQHPLPEIPIVWELQNALYNFSYARPFRSQSWRQPPAAPDAPDLQFLELLARHNQTQSRWDTGWLVYQAMPNGQVFVQKGESQRSAMPGEFVLANMPGSGAQAGSPVSLYVQRDSAAAQLGFYFAFSDTLTDVWDEFSLLRFYFHVSSEGAPALLDYVTKAMNRFRIPFRFKTLAYPGHYDRADAAVLYTAKRYHHLVAHLVGNLPEAVAKNLQETPPLYTYSIRDGVGMAEEPNTGESFGMNRCRMVAEGIYDAWIRGSQSTGDRLNAIAARFFWNGFDLARPHLNGGSIDLPPVPEEVGFDHA
jgi:hypothetical protein